MTAARQGHSPLLLEFLAQVLGRIGIDSERFLRDVELGPEGDERAAAPERVDAALDALAVERGDNAFALTLARSEIQGPLGLYGHLIWLSGTLRDALTRAARFYSLCTQRATLALEAPDGEEIARVTRHVHDGGGPLGRTLPEFAFATLLLRARAATGGRFAVRSVRFAHEVPDPAPYAAYFGAPVTFGVRGDDELAFDASLLDLSLSTADPVTARALEAQATRMQATFARSPFLEAVRRAAAEAPVGRAALPAIARRVGIGARSLRRRLVDEESVTLREILDSVRRERAKDLLAAGRSVKEVALALGFSEPSAFSRAYKRWTGAAPRAAARRA
jgi:AraC-like DNA-binding protein